MGNKMRLKVSGQEVGTLFKATAAATGKRLREELYVGWEQVKGSRRNTPPASISAGSAASGPTQPYGYIEIDLDSFQARLIKLDEK